MFKAANVSGEIKLCFVLNGNWGHFLVDLKARSGCRMENKTFTLSEANALLPQLKVDLIRLQALSQQFEDQYVELQSEKKAYKQSSVQPVAIQDPFFEAESQLEFMRIEADLLIENFKRKGVQLKMINPGLIDFPAVLNGEDILICWKEGEESIGHYHGLDDGFVGRKPLPDHL